MTRESAAGAVLRTVAEHPGLHLRELQRVAGLPLGTLRHHLQALERRGEVRSLRQGAFVRFFPAQGLARGHAQLLAGLRPAPQRHLAVALLQGGPLTHGDLVRRTGIHPGSVSLYLRNLVRCGVVAAVDGPSGRKSYVLTDAAAVAQLLRAYRASFLDRLVDHALQIFDDVVPRR